MKGGKRRGITKKEYVIFFVFLGTIIAWSILLYFVPPEEIVKIIGVQQGYLLAFFLGLLGGVSTLGSTSFYASVITLSKGGLNPFFLAVVAGTAATIGDLIFYYLGLRGKKVLTGKPLEWSEKVREWIQKKPDWAVPVFVYIYTGLTPLPNDVLNISLAVSDVKLRQFIAALLLGNITLTLIVALLFA